MRKKILYLVAFLLGISGIALATSQRTEPTGPVNLMPGSVYVCSSYSNGSCSAWVPLKSTNGVVNTDGGLTVLNSRTISTTAPLTGGGNFSANRTFAINRANATQDGYMNATDFVNSQSGRTGWALSGLSSADNVTIIPAFDYGITVTGIGCVLNNTAATTPASIQLYAANGTAIGSPFTCLPYNQTLTYSTSISNPTVSAGQNMYTNVTNTPNPTTDNYEFIVKYKRS